MKNNTMIDRLPNTATLREKIEAYSMPVTETGCWLWLAKTNRWDYGYLHNTGKRLLAHRVSYQEFKGPIPEGAFICHTCDTPCCVNPEHLYAGTNADNTRDRQARNRQSQGEGRWSAKLKEGNVRTIITLLENSSISHAAIGAEFGVGGDAIWAIQHGKKWKSVTGGRSINRPSSL